ncbi:hypothetical protein [Nocardia sp. NPDC051833]|uniref:hypothetical protein n=1 Tax=Nocardia sp. NPDC051833 TaxID=3155674 RepID=UPI00341D9812
MRIWTLQAPEVVTTLRQVDVYRADWDLVVSNWRGAYADMVAEMGRRGIDCGGAPPVWCWPGRAWRRGAVRSSASMLLGDHEWAHGRWLLKLDVPAEVSLATSYAVWNEYLGYAAGFQDQPEQMDWSGRKTWEFDEIQVCVPELRREWVVRARPYSPDADTVARIEADPVLRDLYVPTRSGLWSGTIRDRQGSARFG